MIKKIVFYDTETTGLYEPSTPSDSAKQPHIVQLAAIQCDANTRQILQTIDLTIKPNGWVIPPEATKIHGITNERALRIGVDEVTAVKLLLDMSQGSLRVSHNSVFDRRIIRIAIKRYLAFSDDELDEWYTKEDQREKHYCTMRRSTWVLRLEPFKYDPYLKKQAPKWPTLEEAFNFFAKQNAWNKEKAHTALYDASACMSVYWAIQDHEKNEPVNDRPPYMPEDASNHDYKFNETNPDIKLGPPIDQDEVF